LRTESLINTNTSDEVMIFEEEREFIPASLTDEALNIF
jgi:hypothetical protein